MADKNKRRGNLTIFVFPYLFLDKEVEIDGYKLKPSYTSTFNKESYRVRSHLTKIAKSFKLPSTPFINQYTYGWITIHNKDEWIKLRDFLDRFSTILRYQEIVDNSGASYSNFNYAVFEIYRPNASNEFSYYQGVFNGQNSISLHYPKTKICLNYEIRTFIYSVDKESKFFNNLFYFGNHFHSELDIKRLLRALEWFNNSYKQDLEVDDLERFISIAVAFETLFNSPQENIQSAMISNITSLLGETNQLVDWVKDFYKQRSQLVHGKEKPSVLYRGINSSDYHLSHLLMARKIFSRCVKAILAAREGVYTQDIHEELISNEKRLKDLIQLFKTTDVKKLRENKAFDTVDSLSQRDVSGRLDDAFKISGKLLPLVIPLLKKQKRKDLEILLDDILAFDKKKYSELAVKYSEFHSSFSSIYFGDKTLSIKDIHNLALKGAVYNFTSFMSWKLFREAFKMKGEQTL